MIFSLNKYAELSVVVFFIKCLIFFFSITGREVCGARKGHFTVFVVDTSASMLEDNAWNEASVFVHEYLKSMSTF